jgi:hypothetical protein
MLRDRANLLARLSNQATDSAAVATGSSQPRPNDFRVIFDLISSAMNSFSHGNAVAAIFEARLAIHQRARFDFGSVMPDLAERLSVDPRLSAEAPLLRLVELMIEEFAEGHAVDLAVATIAAPHMIRLANRLCIEDPSIIRTTVGGKT